MFGQPQLWHCQRLEHGLESTSWNGTWYNQVAGAVRRATATLPGSDAASALEASAAGLLFEPSSIDERCPVEFAEPEWAVSAHSVAALEPLGALFSLVHYWLTMSSAGIRGATVTRPRTRSTQEGATFVEHSGTFRRRQD